MNPTLQVEIGELNTVKEMIQTELFQRYFAKPMKEERDKLRTDFYSDTLKESWRKGGKQEGIELFFKLVEGVHQDLKDKRQEVEDSKRG